MANCPHHIVVHPVARLSPARPPPLQLYGFVVYCIVCSWYPLSAPCCAGYLGLYPVGTRLQATLQAAPAALPPGRAGSSRVSRLRYAVIHYPVVGEIDQNGIK